MHSCSYQNLVVQYIKGYENLLMPPSLHASCVLVHKAHHSQANRLLCQKSHKELPVCFLQADLDYLTVPQFPLTFSSRKQLSPADRQLPSHFPSAQLPFLSLPSVRILPIQACRLQDVFFRQAPALQ